MRESREQRPLALALLVSTLLHALLLSLTFGADDFGLPGIAFPWRERRIDAPDLHVVLVPRQATRAESVLPDAEPARKVPIDPPPATLSLSIRSAVPALELPARAAASTRVIEQAAQADATRTSVVPAAPSPAAAVTQEHMRAQVFERPGSAQIPEPAAKDVERSDTSSWVVRGDRAASAPVIAAASSAPSAETVPAASSDRGLVAQEAQREEAIRREAARVELLLRLEADRQAAERQNAERQEVMRQEGIRQEAARQDAARQEAERAEGERRLAAEREVQRREGQRQDAARQEAKRQEAARQEAERAEGEQQLAAEREVQRQDAARQEAARVELARLAAERRETARQEAQLEVERQEKARATAAQLEAERQETALAAARLEAKQQQAAREEEARLEAARLAAEREESVRLAAVQREETARRAAAEREDTARRQAAELEARRQETARLEAARAQPARPDTAPPLSTPQGALRVESERDEEARREARLRAIGRQLDEEAARREAASQAPANSLPYSLSTARRARLWGRAHSNAELVEYAEAFVRKIQFNTLAQTVRELAKRPHTPSMVTVALRSDGSVESVTFVVSSGVAEVDEAIRRIVDSHRPYPAFPRALAREFDVVEIRRTWAFDSAVRLH
jgi:hypothetical protein